MSHYLNAYTQARPPKPTFTESSVPSLSGKTYIVTGSNTGVGKELARLLYSRDANVYVAARSKEKATAAIAWIKEACPDSKGALTYLHLDLSDLTTIKASAEEFLSKEKELHVLFNNAGVMMCPQGSKTAQGYELQLGTNCVGTFLFTKLLTPIILSTAKNPANPPDSVRVVWVSSSAAELMSPRPAVPIDNLDYHIDADPRTKYGVSKAGNVFHAKEFARRYGGDGEGGVVSVALNPGNLNTDLVRHLQGFQRWLVKYVTYAPVNGAYTELFAGLSPEVTREALKKHDWVVPFGRFMSLRKDLVAGSKPKSEGGTGLAEEFWEWSEKQVQPYL